MDNIISVKDLTKSYGTLKAVNGISFDVERGTLFAFLGENGAGKSTTINILCSILRKDSGEIVIDGKDLEHDAEKIKSMIGIVFQGSVLDTKLSVKNNLVVRASYYGLYGKALKARLAELTQMLELDDVMKREYGKLSGGQRRRVDIARALINRPKLLFLDEPTTGLDPQTRVTVWKVIDNLRKELNLTVFLTTHYMEETANADKVIILDAGKIVAEGTPIELKTKYTSNYIKLYCDETEDATKLLIDENFEFDYRSTAYYIKFKEVDNALSFLQKYSDTFKDFEIVKGDMDDVFLNVTGKRIGE